MSSNLKSPPTSSEVARRAGVSRTTVSFVLNDVRDKGISDTTRQRVLDAARELGYLQLRELYRFDVAVDALIDLRNLDLCRLLSLRDPPACFLEKAMARATADYLRQATRAQGLLVPSVAFLDDPSRWSCILFLDKLPARPEQFIRAATLERVIRLEPPDPPGG